MEASEIRALIEKYQEDDVLDAHLKGKKLAVALFSISRPCRNYSGPTMFETAILPVFMIKLYQEAILRYPEAQAHFYSGIDYDPLISDFEISYNEDPTIVRGWKQAQTFVLSSSEAVIQHLSGAIIAAYCDEQGVDSDDVIDYDELLEARPRDILGILERLHDDRNEP